MAKRKTAGVNLPVPQSRDQASDFLKQIGDADREVRRIEHDLSDRVTTLKAEAQKAAGPHQAKARMLTDGLKTWCEANRDALTEGQRVKHADLGTGTVRWRYAPPKVTLSGVDAIVEALDRLGLRRFLRTKTEVDKEAMLADADTARLVPGVSIGSAGEEFSVEPFEVEVAAGEAA